ncbi:MAG: hypothetical protein KIT36_15650 [Alphaproteobacteria bacterium]|nr:hypothetical protein [Alphaproteobacteria bacterium]
MGFFGKLLVLLLVVGGVFYGWRWWQRVEAERQSRPRQPAPPRDPKPEPPSMVDDMQRCPVCGDYVSINARRCDRPTCPRG